MGRWLYRIVAAGSQPPAGPDRLPGPGHAGCCVAGAAPAPRRAAGLGRTPPAAARRVTWDRLMPVSDLHRQIAVLALAAAGEHGFALGGASALLVRGVISRSTQDAGLFTGQEHGVQAEWATKPSTPRKRSAPTGRSSPAAAVGDRASHSHLPPARCRPACRVPARPCQLAEQPVQPSACPLVGDDHPVAAFLGRSHPGPGQILASGRPARHASTGAASRCCLPARQQDCFPAVCAQTCGSLVRNGAEPVQTQWKCWGFRCLAATMVGALPGRARVAPCAGRENRNYPHATSQ